MNKEVEKLQKRIKQLETHILDAVDAVPAWAPNYDKYCPFCVAAPSVGHFAHCITKTIEMDAENAQSQENKEI